MRFQCARLSDGLAIFYGQEFDEWLRETQSIDGTAGDQIRAMIKQARVAFNPNACGS